MENENIEQPTETPAVTDAPQEAGEPAPDAPVTDATPEGESAPAAPDEPVEPTAPEEAPQPAPDAEIPPAVTDAPDGGENVPTPVPEAPAADIPATDPAPADDSAPADPVPVDPAPAIDPVEQETAPDPDPIVAAAGTQIFSEDGNLIATVARDIRVSRRHTLIEQSDFLLAPAAHGNIAHPAISHFAMNVFVGL